MMRTQVRGNHFVVLSSNGDEILTSKEYSSDGGATRAATNFHDKMTSGETVLEKGVEEGKGKDKKWVRESVLAEGAGKSKTRTSPRPKAADSPYATGSRTRKITIPEPGNTLHATNVYARGTGEEALGDPQIEQEPSPYAL